MAAAEADVPYDRGRRIADTNHWMPKGPKWLRATEWHGGGGALTCDTLQGDVFKGQGVRMPSCCETTKILKLQHLQIPGEGHDTLRLPYPGRTQIYSQGAQRSHKWAETGGAMRRLARAAKGSEQQGLRPRSVLSRQQRKQPPNHTEGNSECFQQRLQKKSRPLSVWVLVAVGFLRCGKCCRPGRMSGEIASVLQTWVGVGVGGWGGSVGNLPTPSHSVESLDPLERNLG